MCVCGGGEAGCGEEELGCGGGGMVWGGGRVWGGATCRGIREY